MEFPHIDCHGTSLHYAQILNETKNQEDCRATSGDDITGVQGRKGIGPPFFTGSSATLSLTFPC
jgi:hypothetical protein